MELKQKTIVSMLASNAGLKLFTIQGEVLDLKADGPHDTMAISEYLASKLSGGNAVDIDLSKYLTITSALSGSDYENEGIIITQMIGGKEVQGIFYPEKVKVSVEHMGETHEVPNIEYLGKHMKRAAEEKSPAVRNFLKRLAPVIAERLHSAEDLMSFIERSELPLTNDGRIIGYKRVRQSGNNYVDCHTGKVVQNAGTRVWMDVNLVDASRDRSCSQGLHVANLGYLRSFSGSHTLIVLVNPEDFIAVPHSETNKCRVCSYDVIGVMSSESHTVVNQGQYVKDDLNLQTLIKTAVEGTSIKPTISVQVGSNGQILSRKAIGKVVEKVVQSVETVEKPTQTSGKSLNEDSEVTKDIVKMVKTTKSSPWDNAPSIVLDVFADLKADVLSKSKIAEKHATSTRTIGRWIEKYDYVAWSVAQSTIPENETVGQKARRLFNEGAMEALLAFKKAKKKGWASFGFTSKEVKKIESATA